MIVPQQGIITDKMIYWLDWVLYRVKDVKLFHLIFQWFIIIIFISNNVHALSWVSMNAAYFNAL